MAVYLNNCQYLVKILYLNVSQFNAKSGSESFKTLVTHWTLKTIPSNHTNISRPIVMKVSLSAKLPMFVHSYAGRFRVKTYSRSCPG